MTEPPKQKKLYKVATELDLSHEVLIKFLRKKGFEVKSHMSSLTQAMVEEVYTHFRSEKEAAVGAQGKILKRAAFEIGAVAVLPEVGVHCKTGGQSAERHQEESNCFHRCGFLKVMRVS